MKYKLFCNQRHEYRTTFSEEHNWKVTDEIFDNFDDIYDVLYNFHEIDYGGLAKKEFKAMTLYDMLDVFEWRIHDSETEEEINLIKNK